MFDVKRNQEETNQAVRCVELMEFYRQRDATIGYCAQMAGMSNEEFIKYLGRNQVSIFHYEDKEEFLEELINA